MPICFGKVSYLLVTHANEVRIKEMETYVSVERKGNGKGNIDRQREGAGVGQEGDGDEGKAGIVGLVVNSVLGKRLIGRHEGSGRGGRGLGRHLSDGRSRSSSHRHRSKSKHSLFLFVLSRVVDNDDNDGV